MELKVACRVVLGMVAEERAKLTMEYARRMRDIDELERHLRHKLGEPMPPNPWESSLPAAVALVGVRAATAAEIALNSLGPSRMPAIIRFLQQNRYRESATRSQLNTSLYHSMKRSDKFTRIGKLWALTDQAPGNRIAESE